MRTTSSHSYIFVPFSFCFSIKDPLHLLSPLLLSPVLFTLLIIISFLSFSLFGSPPQNYQQIKDVQSEFSARNIELRAYTEAMNANPIRTAQLVCGLISRQVSSLNGSFFLIIIPDLIHHNHKIFFTSFSFHNLSTITRHMTRILGV